MNFLSSVMAIEKRSSLSPGTLSPPKDVASKARGIAKQGNEREYFVECPAEDGQVKI